MSKRGICSDCYREFELRNDGMIRHHNYQASDHGVCDGAGKPPKRRPAPTPEVEAGEVYERLDLLNDEPVGQCSSCERMTWDRDALGTVCDLPQPDGSRCTGRFRASEVEAGERETVHGTLTAYTKDGCRCDPCREFWNSYMRWWRANKQGRVHGACETCTCPMPEKPGTAPSQSPQGSELQANSKEPQGLELGDSECRAKSHYIAGVGHVECFCQPGSDLGDGAVEGLAVDLAGTVFGWQHLARYSGQTREWLDATLLAVVRSTLTAAERAGYVSAEQAREREAAAWDAGYRDGCDYLTEVVVAQDTGNPTPDEPANPFRANRSEGGRA